MGIDRDDEDEGTNDGNNKAITVTDQVTETPSVDEEGDDIDDDDVSIVQRSERQRKNQLISMITSSQSELDGERLLLSINDEPWDYDEEKEKKVWYDACDDEIASIIKNRTWELVDLPIGAKAIVL